MKHRNFPSFVMELGTTPPLHYPAICGKFGNHSSPSGEFGNLREERRLCRAGSFGFCSVRGARLWRVSPEGAEELSPRGGNFGLLWWLLLLLLPLLMMCALLLLSREPYNAAVSALRLPNILWRHFLRGVITPRRLLSDVIMTRFSWDFHKPNFSRHDSLNPKVFWRQAFPFEPLFSPTPSYLSERRDTSYE